MDPEQRICQIKALCASVTKSTYDDMLRQGYVYLKALHDMGMKQEQVYQSLADYHNHLKDGVKWDYTAELLDFVVGWCSPQWDIWGSGGIIDQGL